MTSRARFGWLALAALATLGRQAEAQDGKRVVIDQIVAVVGSHGMGKSTRLAAMGGGRSPGGGDPARGGAGAPRPHPRTARGQCGERWIGEGVTDLREPVQGTLDGGVARRPATLHMGEGDVEVNLGDELQMARVRVGVVAMAIGLVSGFFIYDPSSAEAAFRGIYNALF